MNPKFVTLVLVGLSLINTNTFTMDSQLRRPLLGPELSGGQEMVVPGAIAIPDLELGGVTPEAQPGYFKLLKDACIGGVSNLWNKLSRGTKDAIEIGVLGGLDGAALAYKSVKSDNLPVLTSYAVGQTAADVTLRHKYYGKVLATALTIGGCTAVNYLSGADLSEFFNSAIVYAIHGSFEEYAVATGRKNTFDEDFRDLPVALQKLIVQRIETLADKVQVLQQQQLNIGDTAPILSMTDASRDIESGQVIQQPGHLKKFKDSCVGKITHGWSKVPRGVKDAIELGGLAVVDGAAIYYKYYYGNRYLALLTSYAIGQTAADITQRQKYYGKLLAAAAVIGGYEVLKYLTGADLWTFSTSAVMYLIHSSLEEYAVLTGRKNKFTEGFGELPINLQQLIIGRLKKLAEQVRLIKAGKAPMPIADIETGLVTPVKAPAPTQTSPASTDVSSPEMAESTTGSPAQSDWSGASASPEALEQFDIESLGELDATARRLDEQLRLLPIVEAKRNLIQRWWNNLGRGKKDALELFGIASVGTLIDAYHHLFAKHTYNSWWISVFFAYAAGKTAGHITKRQKYYLKILGGLTAFGCAAGVTLPTHFDWASLGIASLMYIVHSTFEEYAKASGRMSDYTKDFQQLPVDLQEILTKRVNQQIHS